MSRIARDVGGKLRSASLAAPPPYWEEFPGITQDLDVQVSRLEVSAGAPLYLYEAGPADAPAIVLVNPSEAPFLLLSRLFHSLARQFFVLAWDSPESPFMVDPARPWTPPTIARTAGCLTEILAARQLRRPHVVTWCAGALIYLWALHAFRLNAASVSFIAPPGIVSRCPEKTPFQTFFLPMVLQLTSGHCQAAASVARRIRAVPNERVLLDEVDRAIFDLTQLPVRNDESLQRYAQLIHSMCSELPPSWDGRARSYADLMDDACSVTPATILHCQDDDIFSANCSREVASRHSDVQLKLYPAGGHFVIYKNPGQLVPDITESIRATESAHGRDGESLRR